MKRNKRDHGRILSVETMARGSALDADAAAGATSITVADAGDFQEREDDSAMPLGSVIGWLQIGTQVVGYTDCDDDTGVITLADTLTAAGEEGDPVHIWSNLYDATVTYQVALVQLDGEYDNPDPVEAEVAEGVEPLPEGDRGRPGEACTLLRISDDEWEIVAVPGRPASSRGTKFYQDAQTIDDLTNLAVSLTFEPIENSEHLYWHPDGGAGVYWDGTTWTRIGQTLEVADPAGIVALGDQFVVEYAYDKGITPALVAPEVVPPPPGDPAPTPKTCDVASGYATEAHVGELRKGSNSWYQTVTVTLSGAVEGSSWVMMVYKHNPTSGAYGFQVRNVNVSGGSLIATNVTVNTYPFSNPQLEIVGVEVYPDSLPYNDTGYTPDSTRDKLPPDGTFGRSECPKARFYFGSAPLFAATLYNDGSDEPWGPLLGS